MKLTEILDPDEQEKRHQEVLKRTGYFGTQGAGSLFLAKATDRIGIAHRASENVEQPNTFGTVGGAVDEGHTPEQTAIKEAMEELGYHMQPGDYLTQLDLYVSGPFRYTTFLYVVEHEFRAVLNYENQSFDFYQFGQWPSPLHFGLHATLTKPQCLALIEEEIRKYRPT